MFVQRKGGQCDWSVESMKENRYRWRERPGPDGAEPWTTLRNFDYCKYKGKSLKHFKLRPRYLCFLYLLFSLFQKLLYYTCWIVNKD